MARDWLPIIDRARDLVNAFTARFGRPPTLRRLHYELVSDALARALGYLNTQGCYKYLSEVTARGRRELTFPDLTEAGRQVFKQQFFTDADDLRDHVREVCRIDRMLGQDMSVCLVIEKAGSVPFLGDWFADFGVLYAAVGGYDSQTQIDTIRRWQRSDGRAMRVLYAGDYDPSGVDITRDFNDRVTGYGNGDIEVVRVALSRQQVAQRPNLIIAPGKDKDSRAGVFARNEGGLFQVELDALDPDDLRAIYQAEFDKLWDYDVYEEQKALEADLLKEVLGDDA